MEMRVEVQTKRGVKTQRFDTCVINARPKLRILYKALRKKGYQVGKLVEKARASQLS